MSAIVRTADLQLVLNTLDPYLPIMGLNPQEWLKNDCNVCLTDCLGNLCMFEKVAPSVFDGHYFFKVRGKNALDLAKKMLNKFVLEFSPKIIKGLTPLEHLGARWMSRQLGFKSYGVVQTPVGPCELFILTKEDWENKINE